MQGTPEKQWNMAYTPKAVFTNIGELLVDRFVVLDFKLSRCGLLVIGEFHFLLLFVDEPYPSDHV